MSKDSQDQASEQEEPLYTTNFEDVQKQESNWIKKRRHAAGISDSEAPLVGLGCSGGGIRSATFNLGILQALSRRGLLTQVDYLSSVSGGGYISSCFTWLRSQIPVDKHQDMGSTLLKNGHGTVLDWLRAHGSYLINGRGFSGWTLGAAILAGTLLNLFVLLPILVGLLAAASNDWHIISWPLWLHLPGARAIGGHDGFMMILVTGLLSLGLFILSIFVFALTTTSLMRRMVSENSVRILMGRLLAVGVIATALGLLPVFAGVEEMVLHYFDHQGLGVLTRHSSYIIPLVSGLISVKMARQRAGSHMGNALAITGLSLFCYGLLTALYHLCDHSAFVESPGYFTWLALSLVLALICNINGLSLHSYYRGRLTDAYMPVIDGEPSFPPPSQFLLTDIKPENGGPLHIVNTTLNTTSSKHEKLRSRNGASLFLSPLYCGSTATGYRHTSNYLEGRMTLSNAFAISGAAIDPNTYVTSSRALSVLMVLINARLGFWTRNPKSLHQHRWLPEWYRFMFREMLGVGLSETEADIHLSDGGHFDNMGLYELIRRQCRYIIISDASADPNTTLSDLGRTIQRVQADFGAEVELDIRPITDVDNQGRHKKPYALGSITYHDGTKGQLLYVKAVISNYPSADVYSYWRANPSFPDQSTVDQFFDEMQFDSYRRLGLDILTAMTTSDTGTIAALFDNLSENNDQIDYCKNEFVADIQKETV
ncbi:hypothetical protein BTA51_06325 [Hahella sp. CCB-MM4]|uniref:hypothetical protein n=1 Tax=Hahella sp. (strain CCB-MM4) TaxID=1926491 RepID=UPI000B9A49C0|nr:hypothetical protein [Hahella sp. CCB-MM4]OZG74605.1 hypothetical protein BTA51_06325 [Hahella sp. CCB-MM4]